MAQRPPSPGDEVLCVKQAPFRPLDDFHSSNRASRDEFKLHVWKTNTLREVAQMLYDADPSISSPLALHAFRRISWNDRSRTYEAASIGVGVTRVPFTSISSLLSDITDKDPGNGTTATSEETADSTREADPTSPAALLGWHTLSDEIDDTAAAITLAQLDLADGDLIDCVVKPDPSLALAPKQSRPTDRNRRVSTDRYRPYRH
ncbi:uncharacterized protein PSANT_03728 [Moesziomyces antarcticus]|uniref:Uncharacterized protein n=1 Tax=Pseudozyma antarctica TaxID=84753 RepID=A0A5C3FNU8_PSEA2|nr:uncharacterized protein PSANT_03728 [Moesziomyces antarcticus]